MDRSGGQPHERIYFLVTSLHAPGGIGRSVMNLAGHLAQTHVVEVIGLHRGAPTPAFPTDPRVRLTCLDDRPGGGQHRLARALRRLKPGIVVSTRPGLHLAAVDSAPSHCILVGQDHLNFTSREADDSLGLVARAIDRLDQFVVLTEADAADYRRAFPSAADKISVIRNAAPWPVVADAETSGREKIVLAAGRLSPQKGFDRLIDAAGPVLRQRPDWKLHIYGSGPQRRPLRRLVADRRLRRSVVLKGRTEDLRGALDRASVFAMTSRYEGLPMVLVEALTRGVPVVAYDCPRGPAEIVVDGVNGRLVEDDDEAGFADALRRLIDDDELRRRMAVGALRTAGQYRIDTILQEWTALFARLRDERAPHRERRTVTTLLRHR